MNTDKNSRMSAEQFADMVEKLSPFNRFMVLTYARIVLLKQETNSMTVELVRRLFRWLSN